MKKILVPLALIWVLAGCGQNSYDGNSGLFGGTSSTHHAALQALYENVIIEDAQRLVDTLDTTLEKLDTLDTNLTLSNFQAAQESAWSAILAWKKVQALYMAGTLQSTMVDVPALIDAFPIGNIDIYTLLEGYLSSATNPYQNATKSFQALAYVLLGSHTNSSALLSDRIARRIEVAQLITTHIRTHAQTILTFYKANPTAYKNERFLTNLINVLIDSAYKLKEWRVGDAAGKTVKYYGAPDATRLEFYHARRTLASLEAILDAHQRLIDAGLSTIASNADAQNELAIVQNALTSTQSLLYTYATTLEESIDSDKTASLYAQIVRFYNGYYVSLINSLALTTKIVEADGD